MKDEQSPVAESIKQLTRQYWGKYVHRRTIAAALAEAGGGQSKLLKELGWSRRKNGPMD